MSFGSNIFPFCYFAISIILLSCCQFAFSKRFEKCELAKHLKTVHGFSRKEVMNWVCIAEYESTFLSSAINNYNWDGSKDYGLFQLNNRYWCGDDYEKNVCRIPCEALLDDDLTDDIKCAKRIVKDTVRWTKTDNGLTAWVAYVNRCQNRDLNAYISECNEILNAAATTTEPATESSVTEAPTTTPPKPTTEASLKPVSLADEQSNDVPTRASGAGMPPLLLSLQSPLYVQQFEPYPLNYITNTAINTLTYGVHHSQENADMKESSEVILYYPMQLLYVV